MKFNSCCLVFTLYTNSIVYKPTQFPALLNGRNIILLWKFYRTGITLLQFWIHMYYCFSCFFLHDDMFAISKRVVTFVTSKIAFTTPLDIDRSASIIVLYTMYYREDSLIVRLHIHYSKIALRNKSKYLHW